MAVEPTPSELARRIDDVSRRMDAGFRDVNERLSSLPDKEMILALLATRDVELRNVREDVGDLAKSLVAERAERIAALDAERKSRGEAFKESLASATSARRFAITAALTSVGLLLGFLGFLTTLMGGP